MAVSESDPFVFNIIKIVITHQQAILWSAWESTMKSTEVAYIKNQGKKENSTNQAFFDGFTEF